MEVREKKREAKAMRAAGIEKNIEQELLERLKQGTYGDIYNFPQQEYEQALDDAEKVSQAEKESESEAESDEEEEREFVEVRHFRAPWKCFSFVLRESVATTHPNCVRILFLPLTAGF